MADIWLFSDPHFYHRNMYSFTYKDASGTERRVRERFASMEEGDAYMIQRWADLVKSPDHVWGLGDWVMWEGNHMGHEFVKLIHSLPGHKRTVLGNHDKLKMKWYIEAGFDKIRSTNQLNGVLLSHYPIHPDHIGMKSIGCAHGHIHQNPSPAGPYYNCSVENTNFEPIPFETVRDALRKKRDAAQQVTPILDMNGIQMYGD